MAEVEVTGRLVRTYCECDLASMRDFLGKNAEKVQDTRKCRWVCAEGVYDILEDILPFGHLNSQVCQTHT